MRYVPRSLFKNFAPFALALLTTAGAQAAAVSSTFTLTGSLAVSSTYAITGQATMSNVYTGSGTFSSSPFSTTGSTVTPSFTITVTPGNTLTGTFTMPIAALGGTAAGSLSITGGTGSYAGYTGSFSSLTESVPLSGTSFAVNFSGSGTVNTSGGGTTTAPPTIAAVQDAASNTPNIAEGSLFSVYGANLAPSSTGLTNFPRPTSVGGVKVTFTPAAGGAGTDTCLIYVGTGQINALLPSTVPVGSYNVTVTNGTVSAPVVAQVVASKPALFTQDQSGTGLAVVFNYISQSENDVNRLTTGTYNGALSSPAKPGQTLIAWGTGIGPYAAGDNTAGVSHDFSTSEPIAAIVGGVSIPVVFAGLNGYAGEDQINFTLPSNVPTGCAVTLQISVNGVLSAPTSISIAPSASSTVCVYFGSGYTTAQLTLLDQGGTINTGGFMIGEFVVTPPQSGQLDTISGSFTQINGFQLVATGAATLSAITSGSCGVEYVASQGPGVAVGHVADLDAGTVTLTGPAGTNLNSQKIPGGSGTMYLYEFGEGVNVLGGINSGSILPGTYTLNGAGGTDVGPFNTSLTIGPLFTLSSPLPGTVTESAGLTINWTGGNASDVVMISGYSGTITGWMTANEVDNLTEFLCVTTAGQKTFTVPAWVLTQMAILTPAQVAAGPVTGFLEVQFSPPPVSFNATLKKDGSTIPSTFSMGVVASSGALYQ
jgi:uncharacterized protein (TIGR03437 family)